MKAVSYTWTGSKWSRKTLPLKRVPRELYEAALRGEEVEFPEDPKPPRRPVVVKRMSRTTKPAGRKST
jgi:hypothetical protein